MLLVREAISQHYNDSDRIQRHSAETGQDRLSVIDEFFIIERLSLF